MTTEEAYLSSILEMLKSLDGNTIRNIYEIVLTIYLKKPGN